MSGSKYVDSEDFLYTAPIREQGNIYKPNNKVMADEMNEKEFHDVHTKEIDLVNRDPKHLNDDVVKEEEHSTTLVPPVKKPTSMLPQAYNHQAMAKLTGFCLLNFMPVLGSGGEDGLSD
ncbi:caveolin-1 isoform X3 [Rhineura floridana]|uniref:caveolin-1 isoform X3 n=1 Tax=Rhineura floridana TaxID=261503 RepID=UPI002AC89412|nr:caveolin-1 isoform X3 [Rhineura floridana]